MTASTIPRRALLLVAPVLLVLALGGCDSARPDDSRPYPATDRVLRSGLKDTCPQAVLRSVPPGMVLSRRDLVPFSADLLGVEATYRDPTGDRVVRLLSGGYLDDLTESYDDLHVTGEHVVAGTSTPVLAGSLLSQSVRLVAWRDGVSQPPCDLHAVVASNLSSIDFATVLDDTMMTPAR